MPRFTFNDIKQFITHDIWYVNVEQFPPWQRKGIKLLRITILGVKDIIRKDLSLRASALTLYSIMSIVPVFAMVFGIAKGFGLEAYLDGQLKQWLGAQPEVLNNVTNYAHNMLGSVKGGVIAGLGFALLLWTIIQVLGNIEHAFNSIWYVKQPRTWVRKFTDYLSIMLVAPLFIIASGTATLFISTQVKELIVHFSFLGETLTDVIIVSLKVLPFFTTSLLLFLLYQVMPNTRVKPIAALLAGIIAGTVFQFFQWGYINFQIGVSKYNSIYGSFASIPLFITWLQFSWTIVLVGAEISYSIQNIEVFESEQITVNISHKMRMLFAIYALQHITKKFSEAQTAPDAIELTNKLKIPLSVCKKTLRLLQDAELVVPAQLNTKTKEYSFVPALDPKFFTISFVINKLENIGELKKINDPDGAFHRLKAQYIHLEKAMEESSSNKHILDI
ncbi:MAG: YihY/virulence factor BrkB family protein [Bacteroidia bacterium]|jgi:membrane protein|nr:YihY/virulence factor BrkB family protein [Bacteroidia bacterium]